jgi:hypothetical protein
VELNDLRAELREWATARCPEGMPLTDDDESPGLFGQCSEWEHLLWASYAPLAEIESWMAHWLKSAED